MNINIKGDLIIFQEGFYHKTGKDSLGKPYPKLHNSPRGYFNDTFINLIKQIEIKLNKNLAHSTKEKTWHCKICNKKINFKMYNTKSLHWPSYLTHLIKAHNFTPSQNYINAINRLSRIKLDHKLHLKEMPLQYKSSIIISKGIHRIFLNQNQLNILDALYEHGGGKKKKYVDKGAHYYSEHSGFIDFNTTGIKRIIINTNKHRIDKDDPDILLPDKIDNILDYEIFYHTHPSTPFPCYRMLDADILYEMPSISDIYHFIHFANKGLTQASIIVAPEGMYIIQKIIIDKRALYIDYDKYTDRYLQLQKKYIRYFILKYIKLHNKKSFVKTDLYHFYQTMFYKYIILDTRLISKVNILLEESNVKIIYYPRQNKKGNWLLSEFYLDIDVRDPVK